MAITLPPQRAAFTPPAAATRLIAVLLSATHPRVGHRTAMGRIRVRRPPPETYDLLLNLTNRHVHAQVVDRARGLVVLSAHSNEPALRRAIAGADAPPRSYATGSVAAAAHIGRTLALRAAAQGVATVAWRRPGRYHGKIKAFIDEVRRAGIETRAPLPAEMPPAPDVDN